MDDMERRLKAIENSTPRFVPVAGGTRPVPRSDRPLTAGGEAVIDRTTPLANVAAVASGVAIFSHFRAHRSESVSQIRAFSGTTAAGATPTLVKLAVYEVATNGDLAQVAITASNTALFAAANTAYTQAFTAPFSKIADRDYMVAVLVTSAAAMPSLIGVTYTSSAGYLASGHAELPKISATIAAQTDLLSSYTNAQLVSSVNNFQALLLP